jgi:hypothetical protein
MPGLDAWVVEAPQVAPGHWGTQVPGACDTAFERCIALCKLTL